VLVETRRSSHRPRERTPQGLPRRGIPQQTPARLQLEPGVVVVFEFRSQSQRQPAAEEGNFILKEAAVDLVCQMMRQEVDGRDGLYKIRRAHARPQPPQKILLPRQS